VSFLGFMGAMAVVTTILGYVTKDTASTRARIVGLAGAVLVVLVGAVVWPGENGEEPAPVGEIISPVSGEVVGPKIEARGVLDDVPADEHVWLMVRDGNRLYPQDSEVTPPDGNWSLEFLQAGTGTVISLELYRMGEEGNDLINARLAAGDFSGMTRIPGAVRLAAVENLRLRGVEPPAPAAAGPTGEIVSPSAGDTIGGDIEVRGTVANLPAREHLWLAVRDGTLLYPQGSEIAPAADGSWLFTFHQGGTSRVISLELYRLDEAGNEFVASRIAAGNFSGLAEIPGAVRMDTVEHLRISG
jgi:hypothetical protein